MINVEYRIRLDEEGNAKKKKSAAEIVRAEMAEGMIKFAIVSVTALFQEFQKGMSEEDAHEMIEDLAKETVNYMIASMKKEGITLILTK